LSEKKNHRTCELKRRKLATSYRISQLERTIRGERDTTYVQYDVGAASVELAVLGFCNWDQTAPNNAPNVQPSEMGATLLLQSRGEIEKVNWPD
jgi:hypothetical protein